MKQLYQYLIIFTALSLCIICCDKEEETSRSFKLLTSHPWMSDSLLADGIEAGGPGELLYNFSGETNFNTDGNGNVGKYEGTWILSKNETLLTIDSDSLAGIATAIIKELTEYSFKITTVFPSQTEPGHLYNIRMTFIPK